MLLGYNVYIAYIYKEFRMKCNKCKKNMIKDSFWEKGKFVYRDVCINIKCSNYKPYCLWKW